MLHPGTAAPAARVIENTDDFTTTLRSRPFGLVVRRIQPRERALRLVPLAAVVLVGAVLRLLLLDHQSFWYDEAVSAELAGAKALDLVSGRVRDLGNPPLHAALLRAWSFVFGTGDAALRGLSVAAGVASIPLLHVVARHLAGRRAALVAATLFALSPVHVYFAQEARAYALVTMLCLGSFALLLRACRAPSRPGAWVAYAACTFLALYTHYFAVFVVLAQIVHVLATHRADRGLVRRFVASLGVAALAYVTWLPAFFRQITEEGNLGRATETWHLHVLSTPLVFSAGTTLVWKDNPTPLRLLAALLVVLAFGAAVVAGAVALRRNRPTLRLLCLWLLLPVLVPALVSALLFPVYYVRYGLIASPAFYILAAVGFERLGGRARGACLVAVVPAVIASFATYYMSPVKHAWREAAAHVRARALPSDVLAFDADIGETPFARYGAGAATRVRLLPPPPDAAAPLFFGAGPEKGAPHDMTRAVLAGERVWLILSDAKIGSEGRYEAIFERGWRRVEERTFRGVEVRLYERAPSVAALQGR